MWSERPVVIMQMPSRLTFGESQAFTRELQPLVSADQPRIVFDFSGVRQIDTSGVDMLLHCVEEVTARDGDLKLAAVPPASAVILEMTRVDRLFEIFETPAEAARSFQDAPVPRIPQPPDPAASDGADFGTTNNLRRVV